jgi:hypothetical protein
VTKAIPLDFPVSLFLGTNTLITSPCSAKISRILGKVVSDKVQILSEHGNPNGTNRTIN